METIEKKRNVSKYSKLSDEERLQKYKEKARECAREYYTKKTPEEKKEIIKRVAENKKGMCEICGNGRVYINLPQHKKTKAHLANIEK